MPNTPKKTFLLGVGAQKTGSTWLYHYLNSSAVANFGRMKEYHIWDALHGPFMDRFTVNASAVTLPMKQCSDFSLMDANAFRYQLQKEPNRYFDYFAQLLEENDCILTGDITPSYSTLPGDAFDIIIDGFRDREITVKAMFIMRDPVERCWSAVRMHKMRGRSRIKGDNVSDEEQLLYYYSTKEALLRTRYDKTVLNLRAAFDEEHLYFGLYETMFNHQELELLCRFCDIPFEEPPIDIRINNSSKNSALSTEVKRQVAGHYSEVYKFCFENFQFAWPNSKLIL